MTTTIDRAGRIVIPKEIRKKAGFLPGTEIEIVHDGAAVRLQRAVPSPRLERARGRIVVRPFVPTDDAPDVDVAAIVEAERERWPG